MVTRRTSGREAGFAAREPPHAAIARTVAVRPASAAGIGGKNWEVTNRILSKGTPGGKMPSSQARTKKRIDNNKEKN